MKNFFLTILHPRFPSDSLQPEKYNLPEIKEKALKHHLFPLLYTQLKKLLNTIPDPHLRSFLDSLKPLFLKGVIHSARQEAIEKEITGLLRKERIQSVVIKGNDIAKEIYGDPNCRSSADIDLLIRQKDAFRVESVLLAAGYIGDVKIPLKYCLYRIHHATYYHPEQHVPVEIHWNFGVPYFFRLTSEEIWNHVVIDDSGRYRLTPEMLLIMLLIHHHTHSFRELKILVDILWALYRYEKEINWKDFGKRLDSTGLAKTTLLTLKQIMDFWPEVNAFEPVDILLSSLEKRTKVPGFLISYFRMELDRDYNRSIYKDKLFARLALDRWSQIIFSYFRTLFPPAEAIRQLYGDKGVLFLPINYLRFITWRVRDWIR